MSNYQATLSIRIKHNSPRHHLMNNNGTWFIHYTIHLGPCKKRCRESLHTHDFSEACIRRDQRLAELVTPHPLPSAA